MAANKKTTAIAGYEICVKANPEFCGIGAGGVQFAYGKAQIAGGRIVDWFREHKGYEVTEIHEAPADAAQTPDAEA